MKVSLLKRLLLAAVCASTIIGVAAAENGGPGIAVGAKAPAFSLPDQAGKNPELGWIVESTKESGTGLLSISGLVTIL